MKTIYSVHVGDLPTDDIFTGSLEECKKHITDMYTEDEIREYKICIAKLLIDENDLFLETLEIIPVID